MKRKCLNERCEKEVEGRSDRKFCSEYCKSDFHYQKNKSTQKIYFKKQVDDALRQNRRILKDYNLAGKSVVRKQELLDKGFNPRLITHYWKNKQGDTYLFCYDQGFKSTRDNGKDKFLLIQWQAYMNDQIF